MSTRGWYEYYVLDEKNNDRTLAMQFFKWGDAVPRVDIDFIYRFFIWINPSDAFRVDRLAIELCDNMGTNLFDDEEEQGEIKGLKKKIKRLGVDIYSLAQAEIDFAPTEDRFWGPQCFIRP